MSFGALLQAELRRLEASNVCEVERAPRERFSKAEIAVRQAQHAARLHNEMFAAMDKEFEQRLAEDAVK